MKGRVHLHDSSNQCFLSSVVEVFEATGADWNDGDLKRLKDDIAFSLDLKDLLVGVENLYDNYFDARQDKTTQCDVKDRSHEIKHPFLFEF